MGSPRKGQTRKPLPRLVLSAPTRRIRAKPLPAVNNAGQWFLAATAQSIPEIERQFRSGLVGRVLFERIGTMLPGPRGHIYIQVALVTDVLWDIGIDNEPVWRRVKSYQKEEDRWPEWAVEVCLREVGVELVRCVKEPIVIRR